jgi:isopropylmalate/homocitrate/citramalate synthase
LPKIWNEPGKWFVNPLNFSPEVTKNFDAPESVFVLDSTVRKITSYPGCHWDIGGILEVCRAADELGVQIVEVNIMMGNMPATPRTLSMFEAIAKEGFKFKLFGTAFRTKESIDQAIDRGANGINMSSRTGKVDAGSLQGEREDLDEVADLFQYIKERGCLISQDMYNFMWLIQNMPPDSVSKRINRMAHLGFEYIGIHENAASTTPEAWRYWVKQLRAGLNEQAKEIPIVPHIHNIFGHASVATCAAVTGGARGVDVTMNGMADTSGLGALEEVVMMLELLYGIDTGLNLEKLVEYSRVVERVTGIPVHPNKPIVGRHTFVGEMEPATQAILEARWHGKERLNPFAPSMVGNQDIPVWGDNTVHGPATKTKLRQMGLPHDKEAVARVIERLKAEQAARTASPTYLTEAEFENLACELFGRSLDGVNSARC